MIITKVLIWHYESGAKSTKPNTLRCHFSQSGEQVSLQQVLDYQVGHSRTQPSSLRSEWTLRGLGTGKKGKLGDFRPSAPTPNSLSRWFVAHPVQDLVVTIWQSSTVKSGVRLTQHGQVAWEGWPASGSDILLVWQFERVFKGWSHYAGLKTPGRIPTAGFVRQYLQDVRSRRVHAGRTQTARPCHSEGSD